MAKRLASLGYRVLVCDVNARAVQSVVDAGACALPNPKAIASEASTVFTCLPSLEALREVVLGSKDSAPGRRSESYVDFSTTGCEFAREIAARAQGHGIMMLDAPITGNVTTAGNGKLGIMCSGPQRAFARTPSPSCGTWQALSSFISGRRRERRRRSSSSTTCSRRQEWRRRAKRSFWA